MHSPRRSPPTLNWRPTSLGTATHLAKEKTPRHAQHTSANEAKRWVEFDAENSSWRRTPQRRDEMRLVSQTKPTTRTQVSWQKMGVLLKFAEFPKQTVRAIRTGTPVHPLHVLWQLEPAHAPDTLTHQQVFQNRNRAQDIISTNVRWLPFPTCVKETVKQ